MKTKTLLLTLCFGSGLFLPGCFGSGDSPADREYLKEIKLRVLSYQKLVARNPNTAKEQLETVIENLAESGNEDLGEHKAAIDQLTSMAKELDGMLQPSAAPNAAAKTKIKELGDLAQKLPGEVQFLDEGN